MVSCGTATLFCKVFNKKNLVLSSVKNCNFIFCFKRMNSDRIYFFQICKKQQNLCVCHLGMLCFRLFLRLGCVNEFSGTVRFTCFSQPRGFSCFATAAVTGSQPITIFIRTPLDQTLTPLWDFHQHVIVFKIFSSIIENVIIKSVPDLDDDRPRCLSE